MCSTHIQRTQNEMGHSHTSTCGRHSRAILSACRMSHAVDGCHLFFFFATFILTLAKFPLICRI